MNFIIISTENFKIPKIKWILVNRKTSIGRGDQYNPVKIKARIWLQGERSFAAGEFEWEEPQLA